MVGRVSTSVDDTGISGPGSIAVGLFEGCRGGAEELVLFRIQPYLDYGEHTLKGGREMGWYRDSLNEDTSSEQQILYSTLKSSPSLFDYLSLSQRILVHLLHKVLESIFPDHPPIPNFAAMAPPPVSHTIRRTTVPFL